MPGGLGRRWMALAWLVVASVVAPLGGARPAPAQEELLAVSAGTDAMTAYPRTAAGDAAPVRTLAGALTGLDGPIQLAVDLFHDELIVVGGFDAASRITVYPRGAGGNAPPLRTITGPQTKLADPVEVLVDPIRGEIFVVNAFTSSVTVHARTADGDVPPLRTLAGPTTGLVAAQGAALDLQHGELLVADFDGAIRVFARTADGDVPPLRILAGAATELAGPITPVLDLVRDELLVVNADDASLTVYPRAASGNTPPLRAIRGGLTELATPFDAVLDLVHDELMVLNNADDAVTAYPRGAAGDVAPLRSLAGPGTGLSNAQGIVVTTSPPLFGAVLPTSRSVQVTAPATVFASIVNAGPGPVQSCFPLPLGPLPAAYGFQTTNALNQPVGTPDTPASIAAGGTQSFVLVFAPTAPFAPTEVPIGFACDGVNRAATVPGLTTVLLSASAGPVPDLLALAATVGNTGTVVVSGPSGAGAFAVATANVGAAAGTIRVSADTGAVALPVTLLVCQTDPLTSVCLAAPAPSVDVVIGPGQTPTFGIFALGQGDIAFDPAVNRVFARFAEGGVARGATSVAIRTQ